MKRFYTLIGIALSMAMATLIIGCGGGDTTPTAMSKTGNVSLSLKDAPLDDENVTGVWVTFVALRYQYSDNDDNWQDVNLSEAVTVNLLDLQNGKTIPLNDIDLPVGEIEHVRFVLDTAPDKCYVTVKTVTDGVEITENHPLTVPSADQTGFKAIGGFTVSEGGTVNITADFDLRKSVTLAGGKYILKPTIKLTDDSETGEIIGTVSEDIIDENETSVVIYAYAHGDFDADEFDALSDGNDTTNFLNAYSSDEVNLTDGSYILSSLAAVSDDEDDDSEDGIDDDDDDDTDNDNDDVNDDGEDDVEDTNDETEDDGTYYDLVVVSSSGVILGYVDNVLVQAGETTTQDITIDDLVKDPTPLTVVIP